MFDLEDLFTSLNSKDNFEELIDYLGEGAVGNFEYKLHRNEMLYGDDKIRLFRIEGIYIRAKDDGFKEIKFGYDLDRDLFYTSDETGEIGFYESDENAENFAEHLKGC